MIYQEFKNNASRKDIVANDKVHFFSTHFAIPLAYLCYKLKFSPNQVTFLFAFSGLLASFSLYYGLGLSAYLLWRLHIILDMADGNLARATSTYSNSATGFDRSNHIIVNTSLLLVSSKDIENILLTCLLIISFYLYYFFDRNYYQTSTSSHNFSILKNFIKNLISLEGYVFFVCSFAYLGLSISHYLVIFYSCGFLFLYFYKLKLFFATIRNNQS
jgi:phosphatidylglycerophosphate synthase